MTFAVADIDLKSNKWALHGQVAAAKSRSFHGSTWLCARAFKKPVFHYHDQTWNEKWKNLLPHTHALFFLVDWSYRRIHIIQVPKSNDSHSKGIYIGFIFQLNPCIWIGLIWISFLYAQLFNVFAWVLSIGVMIAVVVVNYPLVQMDSKIDAIYYGLYDALSRVFWAIALCYIIFACVHNSGGPVNWFLSHQLWQPISRICYAIYLLHFPVLLVIVASMKTAPYFNELIAFHTFLGSYVLTVFVSIIASLAFESPIVVIEKILFSPKKKWNRFPIWNTSFLSEISNGPLLWTMQFQVRLGLIINLKIFIHMILYGEEIFFTIIFVSEKI